MYLIMNFDDFLDDLANQRDRTMFTAAYAVAICGEGAGGNKHSTFRLGAVLVKKNRPVASSVNSYKTHPVARRLSEWPFLHAEMAAIIKCGLDNCEGLTLYVCRVRRDRTIGSAKPCAACEKLIQEVGIKEVKYT